jgi:hypothetical protein
MATKLFDFEDMCTDLRNGVEAWTWREIERNENLHLDCFNSPGTKVAVKSPGNTAYSQLERMLQRGVSIPPLGFDARNYSDF